MQAGAQDLPLHERIHGAASDRRRAARAADPLLRIRHVRPLGARPASDVSAASFGITRCMTTTKSPRPYSRSSDPDPSTPRSARRRSRAPWRPCTGVRSCRGFAPLQQRWPERAGSSFASAAGQSRHSAKSGVHCASPAARTPDPELSRSSQDHVPVAEYDPSYAPPTAPHPRALHEDPTLIASAEHCSSEIRSIEPLIERCTRRPR